MRLIFDFQEKRRAQLARIWNKFVVSRDLFANFIEIGDSFRAQHFLNLKYHGVAVLEDNGDFVADGDAPPLLFFDNIVAEMLTHFLVGSKTYYIIEGNFFHLALYMTGSTVTSNRAPNFGENIALGTVL